MTELTVRVDVDAPADATFAAATDWDGQSAWMLGTRVRATARGGVGVGGGIEAFTGVGRFGVRDTMEITEWDPPRRCLVRHTGRVIRGTGAFEVVDLGNGRSEFLWSERLDLPLGAAGRLGFALTRPLFTAGLRLSLRRFARWAEGRTASS